MTDSSSLGPELIEEIRSNEGLSGASTAASEAGSRLMSEVSCDRSQSQKLFIEDLEQRCKVAGLTTYAVGEEGQSIKPPILPIDWDKLIDGDAGQVLPEPIELAPLPVYTTYAVGEEGNARKPIEHPPLPAGTDLLEAEVVRPIPW